MIDSAVNDQQYLIDSVTADLIQACADRLAVSNQVEWKAGKSYAIGHPTAMGMQASHFECIMVHGEPYLQNTDSIVKGQPIPAWAAVDGNSYIAPED